MCPDKLTQRDILVLLGNKAWLCKTASRTANVNGMGFDIGLSKPSFLVATVGCGPNRGFASQSVALRGGAYIKPYLA